jgi:hypothetical protein
MKLVGMLFGVICGLSCFGQSVYINSVIEQGTSMGISPCEPSIAVSQKDPAYMVAGAILDKVYTSSDSGMTWTIATLKSRFGVFGDPCIVASPKGGFYYLHLSDPAGKGWSDPSLLDRIVIQASTDQGVTWSEGEGIGFNGTKDQDKEWAACSLDGNCTYVTWTEFDLYNSEASADSSYILFSKGNKRGEKWTEPVRLNQYAGNCLDGDLTVEGAVPAAGPKNTIYVSWAFENTIWFDRSSDDGKTWLAKDLKAADIVGGWDHNIPFLGRANGMPVTLCDQTGGDHHGRIYINWADQRNGIDDTDIWVCFSDDEGDSWSEPKRVNDDERGNHQFFTWMTLDPITGVLYTVFYDRRNYEDGKTDVYLASSKDGGLTWLNERISESPFTPLEGVFFGDYNNISAYNGVVRPIWTRMDAEGGRSVITAIINKN